MTAAPAARLADAVRRLSWPVAALIAAIGTPGPSVASGLTVLYNFCSQPHCADGKTPTAGLIRDAAGNLFGTTAEGGVLADGTTGHGTVFRLGRDGTPTVLHVFSSTDFPVADGAGPNSPLVVDAAGRLYGTTFGGGATPSLADAGVAFELAPDGSETALYDFCSDPHCADGYAPLGLVAGSGGDLYGATMKAAPDSTAGIVFRLRPAGSPPAAYDAIYGFPYPLAPSAPLVADATGTLFGAIGTTKPLGPSPDFVFALDPKQGSPQILHSFCTQPGCADGYAPADLLPGASGTLYGTTAMGGDGRYGQGGTLFSLTPDTTGTRWSFTLLHSFCRQPQCADGAAPSGLALDPAGNLYGTAGAGPNDGGLVFRLAPDGSYSVLYSFCTAADCTDGSAPYGPLILDASGNLYGVTGGGGANGAGTVFELTP